MPAHPLHRLGFEPIVSPPQPGSLARLGFEPAIQAIGEPLIAHPQPVGAIDPRSGRRIVQPTDNPAVNQALATDAMPFYKTRLLAAIRDIPGATLSASRDAKNPIRLAEKITGEGQPAETVS